MTQLPHVLKREPLNLALVCPPEVLAAWCRRELHSHGDA
jgi:hypothetical protein